jgi:hypothetical protein
MKVAYMNGQISSKAGVAQCSTKHVITPDSIIKAENLTS